MTVKLQCPKHPKYAAKQPPRANCNWCLMLYELALRCASERIKVG